MGRLTSIELAKEAFHFSAAHFTLFSASSRERLHGHNYFVRCRILSPVGEDGLVFDYTRLKQRLKDLCASLDEYTLMPVKSPWLQVREHEDAVVIMFDGCEFSLPRDDVCLLPIANITLEALAEYLMELLLDDSAASEWPMHQITLGVSSSPGVWADVTLDVSRECAPVAKH